METGPLEIFIARYVVTSQWCQFVEVFSHLWPFLGTGKFFLSPSKAKQSKAKGRV